MNLFRCDGLLVLAILGMPTPLLVASAFTLQTSRSSSFLGRRRTGFWVPREHAEGDVSENRLSGASSLVMRKQKASNRRTRRRQRGLADEEETTPRFAPTMTRSPMEQRGTWNEKKKPSSASASSAGGRGRSRKRSNLYSSLAFYHDKFLDLLTREYKAEEEEVMGRIEASIDNPLQLEQAGYALFDMYPTRRGNLFADEVYRLSKAHDATTTSPMQSNQTATQSLPNNHKFSVNSVIVVTRQPRGSGDWFDPMGLPISDTSDKFQARVLGVGPTYIDIVAEAGALESAFGCPAPNDASGHGDGRLRVRADCFFSPIPYERMVTALAQISQVVPPQRLSSANEDPTSATPLDRISMDPVFRELVLATHAFGDVSSSFFNDPAACDLSALSNRISKPPMASSHQLTQQMVRFVQSQPDRFRPLNGPQLAAVQAALTRRCTLIQGPPGTGKTTVAAAIGFGFVHQCRSLSVHTKVLACAFSNVGADNLAEALLGLGLRVVRIGKPAAVAPSLWNNTIDSAIDRDPDAQKALKAAAKATASLSKLQRQQSSSSSGANGAERMARQAATSAVQASIKSCNLAATKALRQADVIVATSTGAADPRLLAACGMTSGSDDVKPNSVEQGPHHRTLAPDGLPPLSLPFVIVDEACQSVEPATLIPVVSSNSCRSLVLLGDPCQLPPTVRHSTAASLLSVSLMERLAAVLPPTNIRSRTEDTEYETSFLGSLPIREARSVVRGWHGRGEQQSSYRQRYVGSFMLSVQYRMHPSIAAFPSGIFYDGLLSTPKELHAARPVPRALQALLPSGSPHVAVRLVQIGSRSGEARGSGRASTPGEQGTSYANENEAQLVVNLVQDILGQNTDEVTSVAVISPYNLQVNRIQNLLASNGSTDSTIEVKSVDSFQGRERDVVIFSAVRSNREGKIGFLHDWRRLNVALTRAKKGLIVVGDFQTLASADANWAALHKWGEGAQCTVEAAAIQGDAVTSTAD